MSINSVRSPLFPNQFQEQSLDLIHGLFEITSSAFFLINAKMQQKGTVLHGVSKETDKSYRDYYKDLDPAHPSRFIGKDDKVVCLEDLLTHASLHQTVYYQEFLKPMNIEHCCDMFFRSEGNIIAVMTLMRSSNLANFSHEEIEKLKKLQVFLEYTLNSIYIPERVTQRQSLNVKYGLTDRELDVVELIITGAENKKIALELDLSLATVKTHLIHIFTKFKVNSRAKLLSIVFAEISNANQPFEQIAIR